MWKQITIENSSWFIQCNIEGGDVELLAYDMTDAWCESLGFATLYARVKASNKRIAYTEDTVRSTLTQEVPAEAILTTSDEGNAVLKLKYRVLSRPLHVEWRLHKQTASELNQTLVVPLFKAIHNLLAQNEILRNTVTKKDVEIKQYRYEHGLLSRKTIATKIFDFDRFDVEHEKVNSWCDSAKMIGAYFNEIAKSDAIKDKVQPVANNKTEVKKEKSPPPSAIQQTKQKVSPRNRKRQFKEKHEQQTENNLKARKLRLDYQNSQSMSESQSSDEHKTQKGANVKDKPTVTTGKTDQSRTQDVTDSKPEENEKKTSTSSAAANQTKAQVSPPNRKRQLQEKPIRNNIRARKSVMQYENTPSGSESQNSEDDKPLKFIKTRNNVTPRTARANQSATHAEKSSKPVTPQQNDDSASEQILPGPSKKQIKEISPTTSLKMSSAKQTITVKEKELPQSELSAEVDAIMRELKELDERRLSDLQR